VSFLRKHPALSMALLTGAIAIVAVFWHEPTAANALIVWNLMALVYLVVVWVRMMRSSMARLKRRAAELDLSDSVILMLSVSASIASLAGIGFELIGARSAETDVRFFSALLAMATVLISWTFLHTLFTLHYAHRYYSDDGDGGGLRFPEADAYVEPAYWDFVYFAFTIGVAAQTADVSVTSLAMRRMVMIHSVLSFLFNTTILALAINVGASLL